MPLQHRTAARAFIQADERILTVRYRDAKGDWFVLPGGGQQPGEDLHATLRRECREELGISIRVGPLRWVREFITTHHPGHDLPCEFH